MSLTKRNYTAADGRTSIALEKMYFDAIDQIAMHRGVPVNALMSEIDYGRVGANGKRRNKSGISLASAIRLYALDYYQQKVSTLRKPDSVMNGSADAAHA